MIAEERHAAITRRLGEKGVVRAEDLAETLGVSLETIRRDLRELDRAGRLKRVYGGATRRSGFLSTEGAFSERAFSMSEAKQAIGKAAAQLVEEGQTVIIDLGTTAQQVARALAPQFKGYVVTPSLLVAMELQDAKDVEVIVAGGKLRGGDLALSGSVTQDLFASVHADIAFLGSGGIDATAGLTDHNFDEIATRKTMIRNSARSYVLADSTKCDGVARFAVASLDQISGLVTELPPSDSLRAAITNAGGHVVLPESE